MILDLIRLQGNSCCTHTTWAYLKVVSFFTLLHYLLRSHGPFSLPHAKSGRKTPIIIITQDTHMFKNISWHLSANRPIVSDNKRNIHQWLLALHHITDIIISNVMICYDITTVDLTNSHINS